MEYDYDLNRLGDRDFEHIVRALLVKVAGYAVQAFGVGPDGGREAAFTGPFNPPFVAESLWQGYVVLQAKFHVYAGETDKDKKWLEKELTKEFGHWIDPDSKRRKNGELPEYLIIATNIRLSSAAGGGIDSLRKFIEGWAPRLGLKGWVLWEYNTICRLLDDAPRIAQRYAGSITSGDVLAAMLDAIAEARPSFAQSVSAQVEKELLNKQWIRLSETGYAGEGKHTLADVAVDLPAEIHGKDAIQQVNVVEHIVHTGNVILRPADTSDRTHGMVVVGGPGQGKTTIGRLLCQLYRVAMLAERTRLGVTTKRLRDGFLNSLPEIGLSELPTVRRWPVQVLLSAYADELAHSSNLQLLDFITTLVSETEPTTREAMKDWLRSWPWLVVLDGLDEVADHGARELLLERVAQFEADVAALDADVLVVLTTRQQGYTPEEPLASYQEVRLRPLGDDETDRFAARLIRARHADDPDLGREVLSRVRDAVREEETAHLLRSPLQITIMSLLLERRRRAPQTRPALFEAYYETVFRRECDKPTPEGRALEANATYIHALHAWAGLVLQARSEKAGEANVRITAEELEGLLAKRIQRDAPADDAAERARRLVELAGQRLILLERIGDLFSFEVLSLQEFMAARALVSWERNPQEEVLSRLRVLAPSAHWRNTWLLAAGALFDQGHLREGLRLMLEDVDIADPIAMRVRPGAGLAVDLLADGVAHGTPNYQNSLGRLALDLLRRPPGRSTERLADVLFSFAAAGHPIAKDVHDEARFGDPNGLTAVLVLAYWANREGEAALAARQRIAWLTQDLSTSQRVFAATLAAAYPLAALRDFVPIEVTRLPRSDLATELRRYLPADGGERVLEAFTGWEVWYERRGTITVRRAGTVVQPSVLDRTLSALGVPETATAALAAADRLPPQEWPVCGLLYDVFELNLERYPVGDLVQHPAITQAP